MEDKKCLFIQVIKLTLQKTQTTQIIDENVTTDNDFPSLWLCLSLATLSQECTQATVQFAVFIHFTSFHNTPHFTFSVGQLFTFSLL